jgi:hypothetical protein
MIKWECDPSDGSDHTFDETCECNSRIAALAEALKQTPMCGTTMRRIGRPNEASWERDAATILAVLPPDWCGHEPSCCEYACYEDPGCSCDGCELIRLRKIEEAAREALEVLSSLTMHDDDPMVANMAEDAATALRAALEEKS